MDVPRHISPEAQAWYRNQPEFPPAPDYRDVEAMAAYRQILHPIREALLDDIEGPYALEDVSLGSVPAQRVTAPDTQPGQGSLLYLHGGAYVVGAPTRNATLAIPVAAASRLPVFTLDYRLAPEFHFPAALEDAEASFADLAARGPVSVYGDSAGGGLALALTQRLREEDSLLPAALGLIAPWTDLVGTGDSLTTLDGWDPDFPEPAELFEAAEAYAGDHDRSDPLLSPVNADYAGFPPMLIQVGSREILLSDSVRVAQRAREAGVEVHLDVWEGMWHVFHAYPRLPESRRALAEMGRFLAGGMG